MEAVSRRYGRKQRRAAREAILDLRWVNKMQQQRIETERGEVRRLRDRLAAIGQSFEEWDAEIRALLGHHSSLAFGGGDAVKVRHLDEIRQMPVFPRVAIWDGRGFGLDDVIPDYVGGYLETMLSFISSFAVDDIERLRRYMTLRVQVGEDRAHRGAAEFAISESTWAAIKVGGPPAQARLCRRVVGDMMRLISEWKPQPAKARL